jgi:hypothetical protein
MTGYSWTKAVHVLLVLIWLGTDVVTFVSFGRLLDAKLPVPTRLAISRLSDLMDMGPRTAIVGMFALGMILTRNGGWGLQGPTAGVAIAVAAIVSLVWLAGVWHQFWTNHPAPGITRPAAHVRFQKIYREIDLWWRVLLCAGFLIAGAWALFTSGRGGDDGGEGDGGLVTPTWLAVKVLCFGLILADSVLIRIWLPKLGAAIGPIATSGSTPEREATLVRLARPAQAMVISIWVLISVITYLATVKPWM